MTTITFYDKFEKLKTETNLKFQDYCLKRNPFTTFLPENAKESLVDREKEEEAFLLNFRRLIDGEISHIFLLAKRGLGKSHFLYYLFQEVKESFSKIQIPEPLFFDSPSILKTWLKENQNINNVKYLFIDDASLFASSPMRIISEDEIGYIRSIYKNPNIKTINAWQESTEIAIPFRVKPSDVTESFEDINLNLLKKDDEFKLLKKRIQINSLSEKCLEFFDDSFFDELHAISHGNPRLLLKNASNCFLENLDKTKKFTEKEVIDYANKYGKKTTLQMQELLRKLNPSQNRILIAISAIIKVKNRDECELREIAMLLDISKPAVIVPMSTLIESKIVKSRDSTGLKKLYSIDSELKEYIEEQFKDEIKIYIERQNKIISKTISKVF